VAHPVVPQEQERQREYNPENGTLDIHRKCLCN
jgi:hypothetical protein